jgi:hypothetical protein
MIFHVTLIPFQAASLSSSLTFIGSQSFVHSVDHLHFSAELLGTVWFPFQDSEWSESGLSAGLIVGIVLSIIAIVIVVLFGFVFLQWRCARQDLDREVVNISSGDAEHSVLQIGLCDDFLDSDTVFPTDVGRVTGEYDAQFPASIVSDTTVPFLPAVSSFCCESYHTPTSVIPMTEIDFNRIKSFQYCASRHKYGNAR